MTGFDNDMVGPESQGGAGKNEEPTVIQIFNVVPQKVIQVDKPAGYYGDRKKTKTFIYQV